MIQLNRLVLLRELAERETITAVAEALAYTPSAVSQQLSTLEKEVGVPLLERRGRRVVLTAAGQALVEGADSVVAAAEHATSAAVAAAGALTGPVTVGSFASVGATIVPEAFASLRASHPTLELRYRQHGDEGLRELRLGGLDVWVDQHYTALPAPDTDGLVTQELLTEPVCLAVHAADDRGPQLADYRHHAWAGGPETTACGRLLQRTCADAGFEPDLRYLTEDLDVTLRFVAAGAAVAILPRLAMAHLPDGVRVHPVPGMDRQVLALARPAASERPAVALVLDRLVAAARADHGPVPQV